MGFLPVIFLTTEAKPAALIDSMGNMVDTFIENSQPKKVAPGVALDIFSKIQKIRNVKLWERYSHRRREVAEENHNQVCNL